MTRARHWLLSVVSFFGALAGLVGEVVFDRMDRPWVLIAVWLLLLPLADAMDRRANTPRVSRAEQSIADLQAWLLGSPEREVDWSEFEKKVALWLRAAEEHPDRAWRPPPPPPPPYPGLLRLPHGATAEQMRAYYADKVNTMGRPMILPEGARYEPLRPEPDRLGQVRYASADAPYPPLARTASDTLAAYDRWVGR